MSHFAPHSLYDRHVSLDVKINYNEPNVFVRLNVTQINNVLVEQCETSLRTHCADDVDMLLGLAREATAKSEEELEDAELEDWRDTYDPDSDTETIGNYGSEEEKRMYKPMVRLLNHIATYDSPCSPRRFQITSDMKQAHEAHTAGFDNFPTDFTLCAYGTNTSTETLWHQRHTFGMLKPSNIQDIASLSPGGPPSPIVVQCADYAHLFLAAQPYHLFCVGFLVFGTKFCVGIFDPDGITFSPVYDIFEDMQTFIRAVRSLACTLSVYELGFDPTARTLSDYETETLTGSAQSCPSVILASGGDDTRKWCTIGPPVWISSSFLGKCTKVWRVREYIAGTSIDELSSLKGPYMILQTAWRRQSIMQEDSTYLTMTDPPRALARIACSGDVASEGRSITVQNLRCPTNQYAAPSSNLDTDATILHRIVFACAGRPLWEYSSDLELLLGFRDALQAHKELANNGLLVLNVDPGSIMLSDKAPDNGPRGYIISHPISPVQMSYGPGALDADTAPFLSMRILSHMWQQKGPAVPRKSDAVESFIWLLSYCIMRGVYLRSSVSADDEVRDQGLSLLSRLNATFSRATDTMEISQFRHSSSHTLQFPTYSCYQALIPYTMSEALCTLLEDLRIPVVQTMQRELHRHPHGNDPLTHDILLSLVEKAITSLRTQ